MGRYEEAIQLGEETLMLREQVIGPDHPEALASLNNLANDYYALGLYQEAIQLDEEPLRVR